MTQNENSTGRKFILSSVGLAGLACVACCIGPLLALIGISGGTLAALCTEEKIIAVIGVTIAAIGAIVLIRKLKKQNCTVSCSTNCGCKTKTT